ncbi:Bor/Iss family lipoprotein [Foetidibacter luteolus]|uniref:Bor/Iss family lipoprotein n=1 Tax=Foetidibacter luteolus TaxID=2608880 RepID=UPI001A991FA9|nr:hypothetical protein [Foetidibacter luteolus]
MAPKTEPFRRLLFNSLLTLCAACMLGGCYNYRVVTHAQPGTEVTTRTAHSLFWGLVQKPTEITTPNCDSLNIRGMAEVKMKTNLGYALITVVTLGIWSPMKVEWKCGKPCQPVGNEL